MSLKETRGREIESLRQMEKRAFGSRHGKDDFYEYLEGIWRLYLKWRADKRSVTRTKQIADYYGVKLRKSTHPFRAIIDASSSQDFRTKSRWTRALQYLERNMAQVRNVGFQTFVRDNGGVIGCAQKEAGRKRLP